jgi:RNA polymerase sigma-70 factor, ECF subfamily
MSDRMSQGMDDFESAIHLLWLKANTGDERAYALALGLIAKRLRYFYGRRLQGKPSEVEDLVQETLLALHLKRDTYDASSPLSAWVFAIARYKLVDMWRKHGRRDALHDSIDELDESQMPLANTRDEGAGQDLETLLEGLPAAQRSAIWLTKVEGLSLQEASDKTGVSVAALKVQVHRGLKQLALLVAKQ